MLDSTADLRQFALLGFAAWLTLVPIADTRADSARFGADAEYSYYNNVNRAALDNEKQSDSAVSVEGYAARSYPLSSHSGLVLRAGLKAKEFFDFGDLSNISLSGRAAWRFQPTLGYTSPWVELAATAEALRHRDSDIRDGYIASASASVGKYFTDRVRLSAGAGYEKRAAREAQVYDLSNTSIWGTLDYKLSPAATLYGSATWTRGEQVFTLFNTAAWSSLYAYATASAADPVFASAFGGAAPLAYRVDAKATQLELGMNIALKGNQALDFGASYYDSKADRGGGSYDAYSFRIGYLYRFR